MSDDLAEAVIQNYREGVGAFVAAAAKDDFAWDGPGCGTWDRADTARHVLAVADWYHEWLDRALDGDASRPFDQSEFDERNQAGVDSRRDLDGPEVVRQFEERATSYLDRAQPAWSLAYGFPLGTTTVGGHLAVAAAEWHLHAWDLTSATADPHEPADPRSLFLAAALTVADVTGGVRGRLLRAVLPLASKRNPWPTMLQRSGRSVAPAHGAG